MTVSVRTIAALAACILTAWAGNAHAQPGEQTRAGSVPPVASVGPAESVSPSHGWAALPKQDGDLTIAHIPPRDVSSRAGAASAGAVRAARPIRESPEAMAALGDRLYAVFPKAFTPAGPIRRVLVCRAFASGLPGVWADAPTGAFDLGPSLPGGGELLGLGVSAGRGGTVYALLVTDGSPAVLRMEDDAWVPVEMPDGLTPDPVEIAMVSFGPGVLFAARSENGASRAWAISSDGSWIAAPLADWDLFWRAVWRRGYGREVVVGVPDPDPNPYPNSEPGPDAGPDSGSQGAGPLGVWGIGATSAWRITTLRPADPRAAPVVLASSDRLVLVGRTDEHTLRSSEFSLVTGREMHSGDAPRPAGVSANEFRLIAIMLMAVMVASLLVIIRPTPEIAWTVPEGFALADPGRRLLATVADALLVMWVVAPAFGATVQEVLTMQVLLMPDHSWLAVPACMVGGAVTTGIWEGLLGYSPGKFVVGVRVYRAVGGEPVKLGVFWGLVRATIKWVIPPVAAVALFDAQHRHRGDAAARAVVVARVRPDQPGA